MKKNIIITGRPKSGKSTFLEKVMNEIPSKVGFLTREVRVKGERTGFELESNFGQIALLASVDFIDYPRVGKYGVDVQALRSILEGLSAFSVNDLLYIDEIGQMQLFSQEFKDLVLKFADSNNIFVATLTQVYSDDFIEALKKRGDVILVEISAESFESRLEFVTKLIGKIKKAQKYLSEPGRFAIDNDVVTLRSDHSSRKLIRTTSGWRCDCDFFGQYEICSHSITTTEFMRSYKKYK